MFPPVGAIRVSFGTFGLVSRASNSNTENPAFDLDISIDVVII